MAEQLGHRPALDGVRGVAVVLVVVAHTKLTPFDGGGWTGLVLFFALSGFLITSNLMGEKDRTGGIRLAQFYARRVRRLLPALLTMLTVVVTVGWVSAGDAAWSVTYLGNWVRAFGVTDLGLVGHTWSLAVEEQFYLAMPVAVLCLTRRRLTWWVGAAAMIVAVWRPLLWIATGDPGRLEFGLDTRVDAILLGCLLGLVGMRPGRRVVAGAVATLAWVTVAPVGMFTVGLTVTAVAATVIVAHASTVSGGVLGSPLLVWLGTRSYGIYLWHAPLLWRADQLGARTIPKTVALLVLTCVLAECSYRFVEQKFRTVTPRDARAPLRLGSDTSR